MLIEDNMDDAELTLRILKASNRANYTLHLQDGAEAIQFLFSAKGKQIPKLILLDLKMPRVDGLEVLRELKSDDVLKVIPVVVLTSSNEEQDITACYKLGVNAYVVKPVDYAKFTSAVTEIGGFWLGLNQPVV